ncbi:hypothetical protein ACNKHQ_00330 [Shigella flexneri]
MLVDEVIEENGLFAYIWHRTPKRTGVMMREVLLDQRTGVQQAAGPSSGRSTPSALLCATARKKLQDEQYRMPWSGLRGQRTSLIHTSSISPMTWPSPRAAHPAGGRSGFR